MGSGSEARGFQVRRVVEQSKTMRFRDGTALLNHYFIKLGFLDGWKSVVRSSFQFWSIAILFAGV